MRKLLFPLACAACALSTPAHAAYLFGFSPTGAQTLTLNGTTVIQAYQTGWFDSGGNHGAGNNNYFTSDSVGTGSGLQNYRSFYGFDLSGVSGPVTSAVLSIGNGNDSGLPGTFAVWDYAGTLDFNQNYSGQTAIWTDLGSGTLFGSSLIGPGTPIVGVNLNGDALTQLNQSAGGTFFVGGVLNGAVVPEPSTWALLILGMGTVGAAMRRRKQAVRVSFA